MCSVYGAMPEVISFLPIYFSVIVGYSFAGHMLYGLNFTEWATFPRALFRVFELNVGLYDPGPIYDQGGIWSTIFIYTGNIVFCILMLNVFMAIVMSTWERLTEKEADRAEEQDQFSRELGFTDALFLMAMKEDHVDALIDVALQLEGGPLVTRKSFCKVWNELDDDEVPEWTVSRVLGWYWDRNELSATASGFGASKQALASFRLRRCCIQSHGQVQLRSCEREPERYQSTYLTEEVRRPRWRTRFRNRSRRSRRSCQVSSGS